MITWRMPIAGLVPARGTITVGLPTRIDVDRESPVVLTASRDYNVVLRSFTASGVVIENLGNRTAPYILAVIPRVAMMAAASDWRMLFGQLRSRLFGK